MKPGAILQTAAEIITEVEASKRPADRTLKEWGKSHRYAGSKDRAAISEIVFGVYRHRRSLAWQMGGEDPRGLVLAYHLKHRKMSVDEITAICTGTKYDAPPLTEAERSALSGTPSADMPLAVIAEVPDWLMGEVKAPLDPVVSLSAMQARAPCDLRVNTLMTTREEAISRLEPEFAKLDPIRCPSLDPCLLSPVGIRLGSQVNLQGIPAYKEGLIEVQDEGSQLVSLLLEAKPGETIIELCAGGGGKTLAMAATMGNEGRIIAGDTDARRLKDGAKRAGRAGVTIAETQLLTDWDGKGVDPDLDDWEGKADLVVIDAPCSGSGTWRRAPDAKWHLTPERLEELTEIQARLLDRGARLLRPGGRLAYITCSLFERENKAQIDRFLAGNSGFKAKRAAAAWERTLGETGGLHAHCLAQDTLILAPHLSRTDGFFLSIMERST